MLLRHPQVMQTSDVAETTKTVVSAAPNGETRDIKHHDRVLASISIRGCILFAPVELNAINDFALLRGLTSVAQLDIRGPKTVVSQGHDECELCMRRVVPIGYDRWRPRVQIPSLTVPFFIRFAIQLQSFKAQFPKKCKCLLAQNSPFPPPTS